MPPKPFRYLSLALFAAAGVLRATPLPFSEGSPWPADWPVPTGLDRPAGAVTAAGLTWSVDPARIQVSDGRGPAEGRRLAILEEPRTCSRIGFLHTLLPGRAIEDWRIATGLAHRKSSLPPDYPEVCRYELEYADGLHLPLAVRFGESIDTWRRVQTVGPMLWCEEPAVTPVPGVSGESVVLYPMVVPNPRPQAALRAIHLLPARSDPTGWGRVAVLGLALDEAPAPGRVQVVQAPPLGTSAGAGTWESPWGDLQQAVDQAQPGDLILVRGGLLVLDQAVRLTRGGAPDRWLTISAFPGESPVFEAYGIQFDPRFKPHTPDSTLNRRYEVDTGAIAADGDVSWLRLRGLHIHNSRRAALTVYGEPESGPKSWSRSHHLDLSYNTTYRSFSMGLLVHVMDDVTIIGNRVIRPHSVRMSTNPWTGAVNTMGAGDQEGIDLSRNRRFEIAFNVVTGGGKEAIDGISVTDGRIHHNYVLSSLNGIYIDSWTVPIERLEIDHNLVQNCYAGIPLSTEGGSPLVDISVHHNLCIDSKASGIDIGEATYKAEPTTVSGHRVTRNTLYRTGYHATGIGWLGGGLGMGGFPGNPAFRDIEVLDNIVFDTSGRPLFCAYPDRAERAIRISHNLVFPDHDTTPAWIWEQDSRGRRDTTVLGDHPVRQPPRLVDPDRGDFRLREDSPARGAASDGGDLGALPHGTAWTAGLDWAGRPTAFYHGETVWQPLTLPRERCNGYRNHLHRPSWFQRGRYGADFQNLPEGDQALAGVIFSILPDEGTAAPNLIFLRGVGTEVEAEAVEGLPVGRPARRLAFLHVWHDRPGLQQEREKQQTPHPLVLRYRVHYADGTTCDIPVHHGREIADWVGPLRDLPGARLAWSMEIQQRKGPRQEQRLFSLVWDNPRPETPIASLSLHSAAAPGAGAPALFAISTGHDRPPPISRLAAP